MFLICVHDKLVGPSGQYRTEREHIPEEKDIPWDEISGSSLRKWAFKIGPYTAKTIDYWLKKATYEVQAYKKCNALLHCSSKYGTDNLESACVLAWKNKQPTYYFIAETIKGKILNFTNS